MNGFSVAAINLITSIAALVCGLIIALSVQSRRSQQTGAVWFVWLMACACWVSLCYAFEAAAGYNLSAYLTATKIEYLGITMIPVAWVGFTLAISGNERPFGKRSLALLHVIPVLTIVLAFTNEWHGLIWARPFFARSAYGPVYSPDYGIGFWVNTVFAYILFFWGTVVLVRQTLKTWRLYRAQAILVLAGTTLPWISNFLDIFDQLNPVPALYLNSVCLTIALATYAVGIFRLRLLDITPLNQDTILNHMPGGYVVTDSQQRVVAFNRNMQPYLGNREIIGLPLATLLPGFPEASATESSPLLWKTGGRTVEITITPVLSWRKAARGTLYVLNDVTMREQAEEARHASELRQNALLKALPDMMFRLNHNGTYIDYHAPDSDDLFAAPNAFLNQKIVDVLPKRIAEDMLKIIDQVLETGIVGALDYSLEFNGVILDFEARIVASGTDEVVIIVRNITDRKQAEQRAFALALEHERVTLLTRFIQESSHEFRTPLSIIEVNLHLLKRIAAAEERDQRIEQIRTQIARITHLVDVLVQMSRLESGISLALRLSELNSLAEQAALNAQPTASSKNLILNCELEANLPPIMADAKELLVALEQLLDNAVRYTPIGGAPIVLRTQFRDHHVVVDIMDSGVGIPEDALPHVFEHFFRLDSAHSTPGFGLGLCLARRIVELHSGTIEVKSRFGEGSRFSIHLPCASEFEPAASLVM